MSDTALRVLPHDTQAEQSVLACMMLSPEKAKVLDATLADEHFFHTRHKRIFGVFRELLAAEKPIDIVLLQAYLRDRGLLDEIGGVQYLMQLFGVTPTAAHAEHYADILLEKAQLRALAELGARVQDTAMAGGTAAQELADTAEREILSICAGRGRMRAVQGISEVLGDTFQEIEDTQETNVKLQGRTTGFLQLDNALNGLQASDLIVLAARPSMGKTSLAADFLVNASTEKAPGLFFSAEMAGKQLIYRRLARESGITMSRIRQGGLSPDDWTALSGAAGRLHNLPVWLDDTPNIDISELVTKARAWASRREPGIVVVDYLQLLGSKSCRADNRNQEISEITRRLKGLARDLACPVVVLSQLSRECERREDKRPRLSDLRDSGAIEQDADDVLFLYREEVYCKSNENRGKAELIIAKQRNGPLLTVELTFLAALTTFENRPEAEA